MSNKTVEKNEMKYKTRFVMQSHCRRKSESHILARARAVPFNLCHSVWVGQLCVCIIFVTFSDFFPSSRACFALAHCLNSRDNFSVRELFIQHIHLAAAAVYTCARHATWTH